MNCECGSLVVELGVVKVRAGVSLVQERKLGEFQVHAQRLVGKII